MRVPKKLKDKALFKWGGNFQKLILIEECAELTKAIIKGVRDPSPDHTNCIAEEIADVEIMLEQMELLYPRDLIDMHKKTKIKRLKDRLWEGGRDTGEDKMTASEALYGFCGWITTRKEVVKAGSSEDCAVWAELVKEFCKANDLPKPREDWHKKLQHPPRQT